MPRLVMLVWALSLSGAFINAGEAPAPGAPDAERIKVIISNLVGEDPELRNAAKKQLSDLGEAALPQLKEARANQKEGPGVAALDEIIASAGPLGVLWTASLVDDANGANAENVRVIPPLVHKDRVVVQSVRSLRGLNLSDGREAWTEQVYGEGGVAAANGRVFALQNMSELRAYDIANGKKVWTTSHQGYVVAAVTVCGERVLVAASGNHVADFQIKNGDPVWTFRADDAFSAAPAMEGERFYCGAKNGKFYGASLKSGKKVWEFDVGADLPTPPLVAGGKVFVANAEGKLFAFNAEDGKKLWDVSPGGSLRNALAIYDGKLLVVSREGALSALKIEDGSAAWSVKLPGGGSFTNPVAAGGKIFAGSDGLVSMHDAKTGEKLGEFKTGESGAVLLALAGKYLIVNTATKTFALRSGVKGPEEWPQIGGNPGHTGAGE